jgi:hypothetical protein
MSKGAGSRVEGDCSLSCPRVTSAANGKREDWPFFSQQFKQSNDPNSWRRETMDELLVEEVQVEQVTELSLEQLAQVGGGGVFAME